MDQTLEDFLAAREAKIKAQIKELRAELRQIAVAKEATKGAAGTKSGPSGKPIGEPTIKDQVVELLSATKSGMNAKAILAGLNKSFGRNLERSSLSPQLSRLKKEGTLILEGKVWKLSADAKEAMEEWRREKLWDLQQDPGEMPGSDEESEGCDDPDDDEEVEDDPF